jgi:hypothetical protein
MQIKEVKTYKFNELTETAQEKAIEHFEDINLNYDWAEDDYEYFKDLLKEIGISCKTFYFSIDRDWFIAMDKPSIDDDKLFLKYAKIDLRTKRAKELIDSGISIETKYYSGSRMENYISSGYTSQDDLTECLSNILEKFLRDLQKDYEYLTSKESIIERIEANEYDFKENGELF